jgi:hypothetical protein
VTLLGVFKRPPRGATSSAPSPLHEAERQCRESREADTTAIGPFAKLRLKSEIEHLMRDLAAFHAGRATETLDGLHGRYRDLVPRVIALLEQHDAALAHDLTVSAGHLWATLADPGQFASLLMKS